MKKNLYSLRMRASRNEGHLSGAEHLAPEERLETLTAALVKRALGHSRGRAEEIHLTIEALAPDSVQFARLPDLRTFSVAGFREGRSMAESLLIDAGVDGQAVGRAMNWMAGGAAPDGRSMRGAMLIDAHTGRRLESDPFRGVRVSRMDLAPEAEVDLRAGLRGLGLDNSHVREALVLAGKVLLAPGVLAELCWSDDPDYTAGYIATAEKGYIRFPHLKPAGEERGGRAFFIAPATDLKSLITFLEQTPILFDRLGALQPASSGEG